MMNKTFARTDKAQNVELFGTSLYNLVEYNIIKMARKFWNLFFPNEEVYYNNHNS